MDATDAPMGCCAARVRKDEAILANDGFGDVMTDLNISIFKKGDAFAAVPHRCVTTGLPKCNDMRRE